MSLENLHQTDQKKQMCTTCKNFYGSEAYEGMCSQCFKKKPKIEEKATIVVPVSQGQSTLEVEKVEQKKEVDKGRCYQCRKKIGNLGVQCRCKMFFCNTHRLPEDHKCEINYHQTGKIKLQKEIVKVSNGKINHI